VLRTAGFGTTLSASARRGRRARSDHDLRLVLQLPSVSDAFARGVVAGYGIAIPVGAIAVLIVTTAARDSFRRGLAAGLGAATADLTYATVAVTAGSALAPQLRGARTWLHALGGCVLLLVALRGLMRTSDVTQISAEPPQRPAHSLTYLRFLGLTLVNPLTIIYFSTVVVGSQALTGADGAISFVCGVALASASWQTLLAASGAVAGRALVDRGHAATAVVGYGIVLLIALDQFLGL
jgi:threonine/homoserine/homoserine lactone efflux protein